MLTPSFFMLLTRPAASWVSKAMYVLQAPRLAFLQLDDLQWFFFCLFRMHSPLPLASQVLDVLRVLGRQLLELRVQSVSDTRLMHS